MHCQAREQRFPAGLSPNTGAYSIQRKMFIRQEVIQASTLWAPGNINALSGA